MCFSLPYSSALSAQLLPGFAVVVYVLNLLEEKKECSGPVVPQWALKERDLSLVSVSPLTNRSEQQAESNLFSLFLSIFTVLMQQLFNLGRWVCAWKKRSTVLCRRPMLALSWGYVELKSSWSIKFFSFCKSFDLQSKSCLSKRQLVLTKYIMKLYLTY